MIPSIIAHNYHRPANTVKAFLTAQAALTGLPLVIFLAFAVTTLLVSLTSCILLGLLVSLAFTFCLVGFALLFVVPTVLIASCSATFVFIWGFVGYVVLRSLNGGEAPAERGTRVGDGLQRLTGGRLGTWVDNNATQNARRKNADAGQNSASRHETDDRRQDSARVVREGSSANVNGDNSSTGYVEWENKWDNGVQPQTVVLETSNPYDALKTVSMEDSSCLH